MPRRSIIAYNGHDTGLGNRVRVVLGAKSLAEYENRDLYYVWPTGSLFGPKFSDLWEFSGPTVSRSVSRLLAKVFPYEDESLTWIDDRKRRQLLWQIRTGGELKLPPGARDWHEEFRRLVPVPEIAERVRGLWSTELSREPYVGVMIRAHAVSHQKTRDASPVSWFLTRMKEIQAVEPATRFYVSCDVPDVQRDVLAAIPHCVAQHDKGGYNTTAGVRSSIVDLYLLASSGYLLGPHWSSFIHLARHLAEHKITFETSVRTPEGEPDHQGPGVVLDPLTPSVRASR